MRFVYCFAVQASTDPPRRGASPADGTEHVRGSRPAAIIENRTGTVNAIFFEREFLQNNMTSHSPIKRSGAKVE